MDRSIARPLARARIAGLAMCAAAAALALVLRLRQAGASLSFDELAALFFADRRLDQLWGWWMVRETNPPLFYTLLKGWRALAPATLGWLRLLPLAISLAQVALLARFAGRTYGIAAAALAIALFAVSPSDIYQSEYVRGYGLAKLAVTVSFVGLVAALEGDARGWAGFVGGAAVAIHCHTTMLLWPPIAAAAVLADAAVARAGARARLARLALAELAIGLLSAWVLAMTLAQLRAGSTNIGWIEPLSPLDYLRTANLQLLLGGAWSSALMLALMLAGALRTCRRRATRLALAILAVTLVAFKAADAIHPIVSDFTLHWAMSFAVLLAAAALADAPARRPVPAWRRAGAAAAAALAIGAVAWLGWRQLTDADDPDQVVLPLPQDWRATMRAVAASPGAALLVSHEAMGVVASEACRFEFKTPGCPFRLVVLANPARSDGWAIGSSPVAPLPPRAIPAALAGARRVYVFSRYVYAPLAQLGLDPAPYRDSQWDDGELIGPIPVAAFAKAR